MKLRHAAVLALVGWYLMVPPLRFGPVQYKAPLATWSVVLVFDSAIQCDHARTHALEEIRPALVDADRAVQIPEGSIQLQSAKLIAYAQCIATDDPRLKEK
jgi:hypothetical protein